MTLNPLLKGLPPVHPGELLREIVIPGLGRSKTEVAELLHVSRRALYNLIDEKAAVTPSMALRLGKLVGNGPEFWMTMQANHDLAVTQRALADEIADIPTLEEAA